MASMSVPHFNVLCQPGCEKNHGNESRFERMQ